MTQQSTTKMVPEALPKTLHMGLSEWIALLALSILWGGSFFFIKIMVAELPPFTIVLGRVSLAAIVLNLYLLARRDFMPTSPKLWGSFFVMGLLNNVIPFSLIVFGETRIASGLASILNATTPIFTVLVAQVFTSNEKLSRNKAFGVLFGFIGVGVLIGPDAIQQFGQADVLGELACLFAALSYGFAGVYGRRFKHIAPVKIATGQLTLSTLFLIPVTLMVDQPWTLANPSLASWSALVAIAILSTSVAYLLFFRVLATAGATNAALVTFLVPVSALLLGGLILGEQITLHALLGMAIIGLGVVFIDGRLVQSRK